MKGPKAIFEYKLGRDRDMKILVISGFLGAGKTTFIKAFARHSGKEFAVFENELGSLDVDAGILKKDTNEAQVNIWEMTEGCICCSTKGDFAASLLTIANTIDPEVLIVEPTGVGMLSNIITNIKKIEYEHITIAAPITIVDGLSYGRYIDEYPELFRDQVRGAGTVVVSKLENATDAERARIGDVLRELNSDAEIITTPYDEKEKSWWLDILRKNYDGSVEEVRQEQPLPDSMSIRDAAFEGGSELVLFLEDLIRGVYGNVFRAKGVVRGGTDYFRFDVADSRYSIIGADSDEKANAVFIGTDINRQKLRMAVLSDSDIVSFLRKGAVKR